MKVKDEKQPIEVEEEIQETQNGATETGEMVQETPRGRARVLEAYKAKFSDKYPEDSEDEPSDDDMYDDLYDGYEDYRGKYEHSAGEMDKLATLIANNDELAGMLANYDESDLANNLKRNQEIRKANADANKAFITDFLAWADKNEIPEDKREETLQKMMEVKNDAIFDYLHKGMNYDTAVAEAEAAGKNAEIEKKKAALKNAEAAFPGLDGGGTAKPRANERRREMSPKTNDYFDELEVVK